MLIGKPEPGASDGGKIEALLEQLRQRQLSREQIETFEQQKSAAEKRRTLEEATATADRQKDLTYSQVQIRIVENEANAQLAKAQMQKQQTIVEAEGQLEKSRRSAEQQIVLAKAASEQTIIEANAKSQQEILLGKGEGQRRLQIGLSEAISLQQKVNAYGDPRLYAVVLAAERIAKSRQPLVPERVFAQGGHSENGKDNGGAGNNPLNTLLSIVLADATVFQQRGETNPVDQRHDGKAIGHRDGHPFRLVPTHRRPAGTQRLAEEMNLLFLARLSLAPAFMPGNRDPNGAGFQPASAGLLNRRL